MSAPETTPGATNRRQKRMGPAPFASFEDLSDELESPEDKNSAGSVVRLPGIREDATPVTPVAIDQPSPQFIYTGISLVGAVACSSPPSTAMSSLSTPQSSAKLSLQTPSTPRIDISRASSSSHHDSRDSTPERELFEGHDPASAKLGLGFREEGALDLRSSTEELDFQDPQDLQRKGKARPQSPMLHNDTSSLHQRKDSQSSDIGLLSISGRTSRLSSIGSQGSGHSRLSNASHLSVISGQSGLSRSPSPHKMLLETSFCGTKPPESAAPTNTEQTGTKIESEVLEKVLLSRKLDPTEAVLAEGISVEKPPPPEKPVRKLDKRVQSVKSDITIKVDEPPSVCASNNTTNKLTKRIVSKSGVEYIYIPLKGPLPIDYDSINTSNTKTKVREVKSATIQSKTTKPTTAKIKSKSATPSPVVHKKDEEPKYIRIKLKPDYMYSQDDSKPIKLQDFQKPDSLNLNQVPEKKFQEPPQQGKEDVRSELNYNSGSSSSKGLSSDQTCGKISLSSTPSASPKLSRHNVIKDVGSKTPSPSLSRKSSFASLFRSKEAIISPESPTVPGCRRKNTITGILREAGENLRDRSRSRSKSRERDRPATLSTAPSSTESIDSMKSKQNKSVFSIFKVKNKNDINKTAKIDNNSNNSENLPNIEGIAKVEFKFNDNVGSSSRNKYYEPPLECDSIRIPLHSPTHYSNSNNSLLQDLKTSSQDSQETVIEVSSNNRQHVEAVFEITPKKNISNNNKVQSSNKADLNAIRQSSTSSENIVFTTNLGNNNEVFTTKLPKDKQIKKQNNIQSATSTTNGHREPIVVQIEIKSPVQKNEEKCIENLDTSLTETITDDSSSNTLFTNEITMASTTTNVSTNRNSSVMSSIPDDNNSSESEPESELEFPKPKKELDLKLDLEFIEPERKGLVLQQDSFEDELPYIPTTLPLERSAAVPIVPIKQRSTFEMKTYPIERPRSTTPINPSCLEEYCEEVMGSFNVESVTKTIEKLKISLPKHESIDKPIKSPRKSSNTTNWMEFAEKGITAGRRPSLTQDNDTPPPLPPKGIQKEWINFEEIPERRKAPKRIQTLPSRGHIDVPDSVLQDNVVYNYVNPEECKCECHEITAREREKQRNQDSNSVVVQEDEMPLLDDEPCEDDKINSDAVERIKLDVAVSDRRSIISDSSVDLSMSVEHPEANGLDLSLRTPFTSDLGLSSNRSSIVSQDEPQSSDSGSPNAFPKIS